MANRQLLRRAASALRNGGVIAYPTEAVFGLGCDPENGAAVARLLDIKRRSPRHGLIIVAAHERQLADLMVPLPDKLLQRLRADWPGPQTWLVPAAHSCPLWLTGEHASVAVRVSAHPIVRALCTLAGGPMVSSSANRHGHPPARTALGCRMRFGNELDVIVPGKTGGRARPTAIKDLVSGATIRAA